MCTHTRILSQYSSFRNIAYCDCQEGIIHVCWDVATLHLCQTDFIKLWSVLEEMQVNSRQTQHLWIGTIGISLSPKDFSDFQQLVHQAISSPRLYQSRSQDLAGTLSN